MSRMRSSGRLACDRARTVTSPFSRRETTIGLNRIYHPVGARRPFTGGQEMAAISAHSPRTGTIEAFANAAATGAEYVEFDIRRTADGELAAFHDPRTRQGDALAAISYSRLCELAGYPVPRVADVMATVAGKATGHLDLKDTGG